jgi:hypothetical protein
VEPPQLATARAATKGTANKYFDWGFIVSRFPLLDRTRYIALDHSMENSSPPFRQQRKKPRGRRGVLGANHWMNHGPRMFRLAAKKTPASAGDFRNASRDFTSLPPRLS